MHGDMQGTAGVFSANDIKSQIVKKVLESVAEIVGRAFGHQLLAKFALHIEGIGDAVTRDADIELYLLALCGLNVVLFDFNLIG